MHVDSADSSRTWLRIELTLSPVGGLSREDQLGLCGLAFESLDGLGLQELPDRAGLPCVAVFLPRDTEQEAVVEALEELPGARLHESAELSDPGWVEQFNESLQAVDLGKRFTILPRPGDAGPSRMGLVIEAGLAFGTGHHETTSLAVNWLEEKVKKGDSVFDLGTGTGILAAVAVLLGAGRVVAVDHDPEAIVVARHTLSQLPDPSLVQVELGADPADFAKGHAIVVANIIAKISLPLVPALVGLLAPGGSLILSGLLLRDEAETDRLVRGLGLKPSWKRDGEWCSVEAHT